MWSRGGRADIEVRGLTGRGEKHRRLADEVTGALNRLKGVHWAEVNAVTRQVLLAFDEEQITLDRVLETVQEVEDAHGTADEPFARDQPEHPADPTPTTRAALTLGTDVVGLGVVAFTRATHVMPLPRAVRIPLILADTYPRLRHTIEDRLGQQRADLLLSLATSAANATSQGPAPLVVDTTQHFLRLAESRERQAVWHRRESELVANGAGLPDEAPPHRERPAPFPQGPVEKLGDRTSLGSLLGAGATLAFARDPGRAADLMIATMPKAARQGRRGVRRHTRPRAVPARRRADGLDRIAAPGSDQRDRHRLGGAVHRATARALGDRVAGHHFVGYRFVGHCLVGHRSRRS